MAGPVRSGSTTPARATRCRSSRANWHCNLVADPAVRVQIGARRLRGLARLLSDQAEWPRVGRLFSDQAFGQGPPRPLRPLLRRLGFDYEAEVQRVTDANLELPRVAIERQVACCMTPRTGSLVAARLRHPSRRCTPA